MISASHNHYADNGIKLFGPDGYKLSDEKEVQIEALMREGLQEGLADPGELGRVVRLDDAQARYIEIVKGTFPRRLSLNGIRIVIDCAHGAAYRVAPTALYELGAEVKEVGVSPNGLNINDEVGSTAPQAMSRAVREYRADIGIALDGDADRLVICDEKGQVVDGDQIMAIIAGAWATDDLLKGGGVVATVMSNLGLERFLTGRGMNLERTPVGDRYVMARMREGGFNLGGEQSGHVILSDFSTTGDGLIAALQVLTVMVKTGKAMSALARQFEPVPQKLENVRFANGAKPLDNAQVQAAIKDGEARLNSAGRLVVRASGTEPLIRVMAEGDDPKLVAQVVKEIASAVKQVAA
jgi:phosphoglucosamine mutase